MYICLQCLNLDISRRVWNNMYYVMRFLLTSTCSNLISMILQNAGDGMNTTITQCCSTIGKWAQRLEEGERTAGPCVRRRHRLATDSWSLFIIELWNYWLCIAFAMWLFYFTQGRCTLPLIFWIEFLKLFSFEYKKIVKPICIV